LWATSSSSISWSFFLGAFSGFFLPPSRPDMVLQTWTDSNNIP
jgi:hypothetical protein